MFAEKTERNAANGTSNAIIVPPMSASDQKIDYRPFASAMKVTIDDEEFLIRPPSFHVSNIIRQFKMDYMKKMSRQRDVSIEIGKRLDEELKQLRTAAAAENKEGEPSDSDTKNIDAMVNVYSSLQDELFKIQDLSDREMLRLVQLIILDGKNKRWREEYDAFPPDLILEEAISQKRLYRRADISELQVLLDIYNQMNKPEYARKNFQALSPLT